MNITVPDQHIGRCPNLRMSRYNIGTYLRCLDYADVPHVCSFPPETPTATHSINVYTPPKPKRWVKPGDVKTWPLPSGDRVPGVPPWQGGHLLRRTP